MGVDHRVQAGNQMSTRTDRWSVGCFAVAVWIAGAIFSIAVWGAVVSGLLWLWGR